MPPVTINAEAQSTSVSARASIRSLVFSNSGRKAAKTSAFHTQLHFSLSRQRLEPYRGRISAIGEQYEQQCPSRRYADVALVVADEEAEEGERKQDQREGDRVEQEIAQPLRCNDVDISVNQRERRNGRLNAISISSPR